MDHEGFPGPYFRLVFPRIPKAFLSSWHATYEKIHFMCKHFLFCRKGRPDAGVAQTLDQGKRVNVEWSDDQGE